MEMRRYELVEGKSAKFWEVGLDGNDLHLRWGRIGTNGQSQTKSVDSETAAQREHDRLVKGKTKKGYAEVGASEVDAPEKKAEPDPKADDEVSAGGAAEVGAADVGAAEVGAADVGAAEVAPPAAPAASAPPPVAIEPCVCAERLTMPEWPDDGRPAEDLRLHLAAEMERLVKASPSERTSDEPRARAVRLVELLGEAEPELDVDTAAQLLAMTPVAARYLAARLSADRSGSRRDPSGRLLRRGVSQRQVSVRARSKPGGCAPPDPRGDDGRAARGRAERSGIRDARG